MYSFKTDDVNAALQIGINYLLREGVEEQSRNGSVIVAPGPVLTEYVNPRRRVLFSPLRDANPFFHVMESLWILSGANDVEFVEYFAKQMRAYSDDGVTSWGAYGWRWRNFFGWDQLEAIIAELKKDPKSRRCVLTMWNAWPGAGDYDQNRTMNRDNPDLHDHDLQVATHGGLDVPCNTHVYLDCRGGKLNITVCNRSNDIIWGCYGANAVHFSFFHEYMAMRIGIPMGVYRQFSNNFHVYTDVFNREKLEQIALESDSLGKLPDMGPALEPGFDEDLSKFMTWARGLIRQPQPPDTVGINDPTPAAWEAAFNVPPMNTAFMETVAIPMFLTWTYRKWKDSYSMFTCLDGIEAPDWKRACNEWIERRQK
jgi:thymidylate synthase